MHTTTAPSGIDAVGALPWGAHFCQFYRARDDLVDTLVPFFRAGLKGDEQCLWVTSEPFGAEDAKEMLSRAEPELGRYIEKGQIDILDHADWYTPSPSTTAREILNGWLDREQSALRNGRRGLRLTGNLYWLEPENWDDFAEYEAMVSETFRRHRIIGCCSYLLDKVTPEGIFDVVKNHDFALVRRGGEWDLVENASVKVAKEQLNRLNAELEDRVRDRTARLERALAARDEFLSVASHELKTPIASLNLYVSSLLRANRDGRSLPPEELQRRLTKAYEQCGRLDKLISNLLDVSRARSGRLDITPTRFDLVEVTRSTIERLADRASAAGSTLVLREEGAVTGTWDRLRVEQILANLVGNALRHARGAHVEVSVEGRDDVAVLRVKDDGPGIPSTERERIFNRFTQVSDSSRAGGFGIGLWLVREIARAHGGRVQLESAPGAGATFTVYLPRQADAPRQADLPRQAGD